MDFNQNSLNGLPFTMESGNDFEYVPIVYRPSVRNGSKTIYSCDQKGIPLLYMPTGNGQFAVVAEGGLMLDNVHRCGSPSHGVARHAELGRFWATNPSPQRSQIPNQVHFPSEQSECYPSWQSPNARPDPFNSPKMREWIIQGPNNNNQTTNHAHRVNPPNNQPDLKLSSPSSNVLLVNHDKSPKAIEKNFPYIFPSPNDSLTGNEKSLEIIARLRKHIRHFAQQPISSRPRQVLSPFEVRKTLTGKLAVIDRRDVALIYRNYENQSTPQRPHGNSLLNKLLSNTLPSELLFSCPGIDPKGRIVYIAVGSGIDCSPVLIRKLPISKIKNASRLWELEEDEVDMSIKSEVSSPKGINNICFSDHWEIFDEDEMGLPLISRPLNQGLLELTGRTRSGSQVILATFEAPSSCPIEIPEEIEEKKIYGCDNLNNVIGVSFFEGIPRVHYTVDDIEGVAKDECGLPFRLEQSYTDPGVFRIIGRLPNEKWIPNADGSFQVHQVITACCLRSLKDLNAEVSSVLERKRIDESRVNHATVASCLALNMYSRPRVKQAPMDPEDVGEAPLILFGFAYSDVGDYLVQSRAKTLSPDSNLQPVFVHVISNSMSPPYSNPEDSSLTNNQTQHNQDFINHSSSHSILSRPFVRVITVDPANGHTLVLDRDPLTQGRLFLAHAPRLLKDDALSPPGLLVMSETVSDRSQFDDRLDENVVGSLYDPLSGKRVAQPMCPPLAFIPFDSRKAPLRALEALDVHGLRVVIGLEKTYLDDTEVKDESEQEEIRVTVLLRAPRYEESAIDEKTGEIVLMKYTEMPRIIEVDKLGDPLRLEKRYLPSLKSGNGVGFEINVVALNGTIMTSQSQSVNRGGNEFAGGGAKELLLKHAQDSQSGRAKITIATLNESDTKMIGNVHRVVDEDLAHNPQHRRLAGLEGSEGDSKEDNITFFKGKSPIRGVNDQQSYQAKLKMFYGDDSVNDNINPADFAEELDGIFDATGHSTHYDLVDIPEKDFMVSDNEDGPLIDPEAPVEATRVLWDTARPADLPPFVLTLARSLKSHDYPPDIALVERDTKTGDISISRYDSSPDSDGLPYDVRSLDECGLRFRLRASPHNPSDVIEVIGKNPITSKDYIECQLPSAPSGLMDRTPVRARDARGHLSGIFVVETPPMTSETFSLWFPEKKTSASPSQSMGPCVIYIDSVTQLKRIIMLDEKRNALKLIRKVNGVCEVRASRADGSEAFLAEYFDPEGRTGSIRSLQRPATPLLPMVTDSSPAIRAVAPEGTACGVRMKLSCIEVVKVIPGLEDGPVIKADDLGLPLRVVSVRVRQNDGTTNRRPLVIGKNFNGGNKIYAVLLDQTIGKMVFKIKNHLNMLHLVKKNILMNKINGFLSNDSRKDIQNKSNNSNSALNTFGQRRTGDNTRLLTGIPIRSFSASSREAFPSLPTINFRSRTKEEEHLARRLAASRGLTYPVDAHAVLPDIMLVAVSKSTAEVKFAICRSKRFGLAERTDVDGCKEVVCDDWTRLDWGLSDASRQALVVRPMKVTFYKQLLDLDGSKSIHVYMAALSNNSNKSQSDNSKVVVELFPPSTTLENLLKDGVTLDLFGFYELFDKANDRVLAILRDSEQAPMGSISQQIYQEMVTHQINSSSTPRKTLLPSEIPPPIKALSAYRVRTGSTFNEDDLTTLAKGEGSKKLIEQSFLLLHEKINDLESISDNADINEDGKIPFSKTAPVILSLTTDKFGYCLDSARFTFTDPRGQMLRLQAIASSDSTDKQQVVVGGLSKFSDEFVPITYALNLDDFVAGMDIRMAKNMQNSEDMVTDQSWWTLQPLGNVNGTIMRLKTHFKECPHTYPILGIHGSLDLQEIRAINAAQNEKKIRKVNHEINSLRRSDRDVLNTSQSGLSYNGITLSHTPSSPSKFTMEPPREQTFSTEENKAFNKIVSEDGGLYENPFSTKMTQNLLGQIKLPPLKQHKDLIKNTSSMMTVSNSSPIQTKPSHNRTVSQQNSPFGELSERIDHNYSGPHALRQSTHREDRDFLKQETSNRFQDTSRILSVEESQMYNPLSQRRSASPLTNLPQEFMKNQNTFSGKNKNDYDGKISSVSPTQHYQTDTSRSIHQAPNFDYDDGLSFPGSNLTTARHLNHNSNSHLVTQSLSLSTNRTRNAKGFEEQATSSDPPRGIDTINNLESIKDELEKSNLGSSVRFNTAILNDTRQNISFMHQQRSGSKESNGFNNFNQSMILPFENNNQKSNRSSINHASNLSLPFNNDEFNPTDSRGIQENFNYDDYGIQDDDQTNYLSRHIDSSERLKFDIGQTSPLNQMLPIANRSAMNDNDIFSLNMPVGNLEARSSGSRNRHQVHPNVDSDALSMRPSIRLNGNELNNDLNFGSTLESTHRLLHSALAHNNDYSNNSSKQNGSNERSTTRNDLSDNRFHMDPPSHNNSSNSLPRRNSSKPIIAPREISPPPAINPPVFLEDQQPNLSNPLFNSDLTVTEAIKQNVMACLPPLSVGVDSTGRLAVVERAGLSITVTTMTGSKKASLDRMYDPGKPSVCARDVLGLPLKAFPAQKTTLSFLPFISKINSAKLNSSSIGAIEILGGTSTDGAGVISAVVVISRDAVHQPTLGIDFRGLSNPVEPVGSVCIVEEGPNGVPIIISTWDQGDDRIRNHVRDLNISSSSRVVACDADETGNPFTILDCKNGSKLLIGKRKGNIPYVAVRYISPSNIMDENAGDDIYDTIKIEENDDEEDILRKKAALLNGPKRSLQKTIDLPPVTKDHLLFLPAIPGVSFIGRRINDGKQIEVVLKPNSGLVSLMSKELGKSKIITHDRDEHALVLSSDAKDPNRIYVCGFDDTSGKIYKIVEIHVDDYTQIENNTSNSIRQKTHNQRMFKKEQTKSISDDLNPETMLESAFNFLERDFYLPVRGAAHPSMGFIPGSNNIKGSEILWQPIIPLSLNSPENAPAKPIGCRLQTETASEIIALPDDLMLESYGTLIDDSDDVDNQLYTGSNKGKSVKSPTFDSFRDKNEDNPMLNTNEKTKKLRCRFVCETKHVLGTFFGVTYRNQPCFIQFLSSKQPNHELAKAGTLGQMYQCEDGKVYMNNELLFDKVNTQIRIFTSQRNHQNITSTTMMDRDKRGHRFTVLISQIPILAGVPNSAMIRKIEIQGIDIQGNSYIVSTLIHPEDQLVLNRYGFTKVAVSSLQSTLSILPDPVVSRGFDSRGWPIFLSPEGIEGFPIVLLFDIGLNLHIINQDAKGAPLLLIPRKDQHTVLILAQPPDEHANSLSLSHLEVLVIGEGRTVLASLGEIIASTVPAPVKERINKVKMTFGVDDLDKQSIILKNNGILLDGNPASVHNSSLCESWFIHPYTLEASKINCREIEASRAKLNLQGANDIQKKSVLLQTSTGRGDTLDILSGSTTGAVRNVEKFDPEVKRAKALFQWDPKAFLELMAQSKNVSRVDNDSDLSNEVDDSQSEEEKENDVFDDDSSSMNDGVLLTGALDKKDNEAKILGVDLVERNILIRRKQLQSSMKELCRRIGKQLIEDRKLLKKLLKQSGNSEKIKAQIAYLPIRLIAEILSDYFQAILSKASLEDLDIKHGEAILIPDNVLRSGARVPQDLYHHFELLFPTNFPFPRMPFSDILNSETTKALFSDIYNRQQLYFGQSRSGLPAFILMDISSFDGAENKSSFSNSLNNTANHTFNSSSVSKSRNTRSNSKHNRKKKNIHPLVDSDCVLIAVRTNEGRTQIFYSDVSRGTYIETRFDHAYLAAISSSQNRVEQKHQQLNLSSSSAISAKSLNLSHQLTILPSELEFFFISPESPDGDLIARVPLKKNASLLFSDKVDDTNALDGLLPFPTHPSLSPSLLPLQQFVSPKLLHVGLLSFPSSPSVAHETLQRGSAAALSFDPLTGMLHVLVEDPIGQPLFLTREEAAPKLLIGSKLLASPSPLNSSANQPFLLVSQGPSTKNGPTALPRVFAGLPAPMLSKLENGNFIANNLMNLAHIDSGLMHGTLNKALALSAASPSFLGPFHFQTSFFDVDLEAVTGSGTTTVNSSDPVTVGKLAKIPIVFKNDAMSKQFDDKWVFKSVLESLLVANENKFAQDEIRRTYLMIQKFFLDRMLSSNKRNRSNKDFNSSQSSPITKYSLLSAATYAPAFTDAMNRPAFSFDEYIVRLVAIAESQVGIDRFGNAQSLDKLSINGNHKLGPILAQMLADAPLSLEDPNVVAENLGLPGIAPSNLSVRKPSFESDDPFVFTAEEAARLYILQKNKALSPFKKSKDKLDELKKPSGIISRVRIDENGNEVIEEDFLSDFAADDDNSDINNPFFTREKAVQELEAKLKKLADDYPEIYMNSTQNIRGKHFNQINSQNDTNNNDALDEELEVEWEDPPEGSDEWKAQKYADLRDQNDASVRPFSARFPGVAPENLKIPYDRVLVKNIIEKALLPRGQSVEPIRIAAKANAPQKLGAGNAALGLGGLAAEISRLNANRQEEVVSLLMQCRRLELDIKSQGKMINVLEFDLRRAHSMATQQSQSFWNSYKAKNNIRSPKKSNQQLPHFGF